MMESVSVIGGTHGTGLLIGNLLLKHGYRVRVVGRRPATTDVQLGAGAEATVADVTVPDTLAVAVKDVDHIIFTAGVTKRPAGESLVKATEFDGVRHTLAAAQQAGFTGRFLYMTSLGVARPSLTGNLLNLVKRNTLRWRARAEDEIRTSGFAYTIIRAGLLTNARGGQRAIEVSQNNYPLAPRYRIARADVAEVFVQAIAQQATLNKTFEIAWSRETGREPWDVLFAKLKPAPQLPQGRTGG